MKYTAHQEQDLKEFEPRAMEIIIECKLMTYPQIRFRLKNLVDEKYNSLKKLKFGNDWISRRKRRAGLIETSISKEELLKNLASTIKKRMNNSFIAVVTTKSVKTLWKSRLKEMPTDANLRDFKHQFGFDTITNPFKKNFKNAWVMKTKN